MLALRSIVTATVLSAACAEDCASPEGASLMQTKTQREKPKQNENDELVASLLARAVDKVDSKLVSDEHTTDKETHDFHFCNLERTMKSKGTQKFEGRSRKSIVTGNEYQYADEVEFAVLDRINEMRRAGFNCTDQATGEVVTFEPKCRNEDLIFDCRLWWAAKQHSEDMGKRDYYAHDTQYPFPSRKSYGVSDGGERLLEPFYERVKAYAWHVRAHKEVLMGSRGERDTPEYIVQAWLDSFGHCKALGTKNAEVMGIGRAPCTAHANGLCVDGMVGTFTGGLFQQRGFFASWDQSLDTSCYPTSRNKENR